MGTVTRKRPKPPYLDILDNNDGVFLNILENMNTGKTPTFLFWASQFSQKWKIPYIVKSDTDTFMKMDKIFDLLQNELPPIPGIDGDENVKQPSIMAGHLWHTPWKFLPDIDQHFWDEQFYMGLHFYLLGGFYLMSSNLAEDATREARHFQQIIPDIVINSTNNKPHGYLAGHEDHDTTSLAEIGHYQSLMFKNKSNNTKSPSVIQWVTMPKSLLAFKHPVKLINKRKWKRLVANELNHSTPEITSQSETFKPQSPSQVQTLVLIYDVPSSEARNYYRQQLFAPEHLGNG